jgi:hypothetical protein
VFPASPEEKTYIIFSKISVFFWLITTFYKKHQPKTTKFFKENHPEQVKKIFVHRIDKDMKTFLNWLAEDEIVGIYPPEYGGIGTHPPLANQTGSDQVYVKASRNSLKGKKGKNPYKKMPPA